MITKIEFWVCILIVFVVFLLFAIIILERKRIGGTEMKDIFNKALIELGKRVDLEENPNYIIKKALEVAIDEQIKKNRFERVYIAIRDQLKAKDIVVEDLPFDIMTDILVIEEELK